MGKSPWAAGGGARGMMDRMMNKPNGVVGAMQAALPGGGGANSVLPAAQAPVGIQSTAVPGAGMGDRAALRSASGKVAAPGVPAAAVPGVCPTCGKPT